MCLKATAWARLRSGATPLGKGTLGQTSNNPNAQCLACGQHQGARLSHLIACQAFSDDHAWLSCRLLAVGIIPREDPWERAWQIFRDSEEALQDRIAYAAKLEAHLRGLIQK